MYLPAVLCFFGVKGSGKDTAAGHLTRAWPTIFHQTAFAEPLKDVFLQIYPKIPREHVYGETKLREIECKDYPLQGSCLSCGTEMERLGYEGRYWKCIRCNLTYPQYLTPRIGLQSLGTEWGRRCYINTWIDACLEKAATKAPMIVTDGRFFNEYGAAARYGVVTVALTRGLERSTDPHPSESEPRDLVRSGLSGMRRFDIILDNEHYTVEEAGRRLLEAVTELCTWQPTHIKWSNKSV
jgi:hypothetical protein